MQIVDRILSEKVLGMVLVLLLLGIVLALVEQSPGDAVMGTSSPMAEMATAAGL